MSVSKRQSERPEVIARLARSGTVSYAGTVTLGRSRMGMKTRPNLVLMLALAVTLIGAMSTMAQPTRAGRNVAPPRPNGPCDVYAAAGDPCAAAHSTTRALYASYNGPLYQVLRQSDGKTLDIGVVPPTASPLP